MIIWTPLPMQLVTEGMEPALPQTMEVQVQGRLVEVVPDGAGGGQVVRLISSDPQDYLNPAFQPGATVRWDADPGQGK